MTALLVAASFVAPSPREAGLPVYPDLPALFAAYSKNSYEAMEAHKNGAYVLRVEVGPLLPGSTMFRRSGIHRIIINGADPSELEGKTVRMKVRVGVLSRSGLTINVWPVK
jgi:hypothetical protein